jgi:alpha,alpha-trehalose phosphorylase
MRVDLTADAIRFEIEVGEADASVPLQVRGEPVLVTAAAPVTVTLDGHGARRVGAPTMQNVRGARRADGTLLTASIPTLSLDVDEADAAAVFD